MDKLPNKVQKFKIPKLLRYHNSTLQHYHSYLPPYKIHLPPYINSSNLLVQPLQELIKPSSNTFLGILQLTF